MIPEDKEQKEQEDKPQRKHSMVARILRVAGFTAGGLVLLVVLLLAGATFYLTPERLTEIVNREASQNLNADVRAHNISFTLWSSWPHLRVEMDSMTIRSRVFDSLPAAERKNIPAGADFLASTGRFNGGINLLSLLRGQISLHEVSLGSLRLNLFSLNDSLSNFDIVPPDTAKSRIPYITADRIRLINPGYIHYRSIPDSADASIALTSLSLSRLDKDKIKKDKDNKKNIYSYFTGDSKSKKKSRYDVYDLKIGGNIDAAVDALEILHGFPFRLNGNVALGFDPFRFSTSNYHVNLGALRTNVDMNMQVGGDSRLDAFSLHLDNVDLFRILEYIPGVNMASISSLQSVDMPLTVNATARLTSPWRLSSTVLPSAEVDFNIADGDISYTLNDGRRCVITHYGAGGRLLFDGTNPANSSFIIPPFRLAGDGVDLTVAADMDRLLGNPTAQASIEGEAVLKQIAGAFPFLRPYALEGKVETLATVEGDLPPLSQLSSPADLATADFILDGKVKLRDFSAILGKRKMKASGKELDIEIDGDSKGGNVPRKILFTATGEGLALMDRGSGMKMDIKDIKIDGDADLAKSSGKIKVKTSAVDMKSGGERFALNDISLYLSASALDKPLKVKNYSIPSYWLADTASLAFAPHSSEFLQVKMPKEALDFMSKWKVYADLKMKSGVISTPSFPARNTIRNLDIAASFDSVVVRDLRLRSRSSALAMRGKVTNLRQFLGSATPAPLYLDMDVAMDTMQINQLAGTFLRSRGGKKLNASPDSQPDDTLAMLLPRNIVADIHATADETRYTNLHLYDLATDLHLRDGNLDVENMRIAADFGHAYLNFKYNTENIQDLKMQADLGLLDLNVVGFFKKFHALLMMMPQMKNLEGEVSAEANLSLLSFPNMYINTPSLNADIRVQGDGLTVHQSPFIRHITRMILIREDGPLHIADMNVHASIHDNLLELYPFNFSVDRYRLRMGGLNNFNGDLYYHIGVDKSPIPFPFGINIVGKFSHPKIRFGGAHWKIRKGEEITSSVMDEMQINIKAEGRKFLKEFLRKAAESE